MKINEWIWLDVKNDWVDIVKQSPLDYYTDIYNPWQTKERLRVWIEVEWSTQTISKYCFATLSTNEVCVSWTSKTLSLNTFDTNDTWMSATNNRVTITEDGLYKVSWSVTFATNSSGVREILVRKNWTTNTNLEYQPNAISWANTSCVFDRSFNLVAWDYIEVRAYQTSWWNLDVLSNNQKTFIQVIKI